MIFDKITLVLFLKVKFALFQLLLSFGKKSNFLPNENGSTDGINTANYWAQYLKVFTPKIKYFSLHVINPMKFDGPM